MRSLVTGGAGFIGSNLVDALVARGDQVVVLDDLSSGKRANLEDAIAKGASLIEGSVSDRSAVDEAMASAQPECVFHLAAQIDVRRSIADPLFDLEVNVGGTINLLEAAVGGRRPPLRLRLHRRRHLRRGRRAATCRSPRSAERRPDAPYGTVEDGGRGLPRPLLAAARDSRPSPCGSATSSARARTRTARPAWSRSSPALCSPAGRPRSSATACRPATTSTSATSSAPSSRPPSPRPPERSTSAPGSRPTCSSSAG